MRPGAVLTNTLTSRDRMGVEIRPHRTRVASLGAMMAPEAADLADKTAHLCKQLDLDALLGLDVLLY